jgi:hypothetical protein
VPAPWTAQNAAHRALENRRRFSTPPTRIIRCSLLSRTKDQNLSVSGVSYPQILRRRRKVVVTQALPEIQSHIVEIFDRKSTEAFLPQRCFASKTGYHLRRTVVLDPVAAYFVYELIYHHRAKLMIKRPANRRLFGYMFRLGRPVAPSLSYGEFRAAVREAAVEYKHALAADVSLLQFRVPPRLG